MPVVLSSSDRDYSPVFPQFKLLEIEDREYIQARLTAYQPQASEWTFTNLFMWRHHYGLSWSTYEDTLMVVSQQVGATPFGFPPIGPGSRQNAARLLLQWLEEVHRVAGTIERADPRLVSELEGSPDFAIEATRDQFDYVYRCEDLIQLGGRKYHAKRNHLNKLVRSYHFDYRPLTRKHTDACLQLADNWCQWRRCEDDLNLIGEWDAIREALQHFEVLELQGGVVLLNQKVEAFSLGELLNQDTAVIHIEKANPEIPGMYSLINQQFCEQCWSQVEYINREQDLGEPGLRKAKLSYHPDHLVEKHRIRLS